MNLKLIIKNLIKLPTLCESFSMRNILEVLALFENQKKVVRVPIKNHEWNILNDFCKTNNLQICHSNFKISIVRETSLGDIFTENVPWNSNSDKILGFVAYIATSKDIAQMAADMESRADSENLGELYQYPNCCVENYSKKIETGDFWLDVLLSNSKGFNHSFYSNKLAYLFDDISIISDYFPCSLNCKETILMGKKYRDILLKYDLEDFYINIKNHLCKPIIVGDGFLLQFNSSDLIVGPNNSRLFEWKNNAKHSYLNQDNFSININYDLSEAFLNKRNIGRVYQFSDK